MNSTVFTMTVCSCVCFFLAGASTCGEPEEATLIQSRLGETFSDLQIQGGSWDAFHMEYVDVEQQRVSGSSTSQISKQTGALSPWMTEKEIELLGETLSKAEAYFEYGIGGSTVFAARFKNLKCMQCMESSDEWIQKVSQYHAVSAALKAGRLELVHRDIGPTEMMGYPRDKNEAKFRKFSDPPVGSCGDHMRLVVLVDGRFRVACFLKMLASMSSEQAGMTHLLVHDYSERENYHVVEQFANLIEQRERLAMFEMKPDVDMKALDAAIRQHELDPK